MGQKPRALAGRNAHNAKQQKSARNVVSQPKEVWDPQLIKRRRLDGGWFCLAEVFKVAGANAAFEELLQAGCDRDELTGHVMRFHHWSAAKAGRSVVQLSGKQRRDLDRLLATLRQVEHWRPFPGIYAPEAGESLFFSVRDCRVYLEAAIDLLSKFPNRKWANARALAVSHIAGQVRKQTGQPHHKALRILLDAGLLAAGITDLIRNDEAFSKMSELRTVARKHPN